MKRRQFLTAGAMATGGAATALAAPALAQTAPPLTWRLTSSFPKSLDVLFGTAQIFAKYVAEATDNTFIIQPYAAGEIAPGLQALDTVTSGAVECAHTPGGFYLAKDPTLSLAGGIPFGLSQRHHAAWLSHGGGSQLINESLKKFNALGLPMGSGGALTGGWFRREINSVEDFNGLKIRISDMGGQVLARLGAVPQQVSRQEIAASLENGTLDAAVVAGPYDDEKLGLARVARSYYAPAWWSTSATVHLMINLDAWAKLPKPYQSIITLASEAANAWMLARYDTLNGPALKRIMTAGTAIKSFPAPVLDACLKASGDHYSEIAAQNQLFKRALDQIGAYRSEQLNWWQISDLAMDNLMIGPPSKG